MRTGGDSVQNKEGGGKGDMGEIKKKRESNKKKQRVRARPKEIRCNEKKER